MKLPIYCPECNKQLQAYQDLDSVIDGYNINFFNWDFICKGNHKTRDNIKRKTHPNDGYYIYNPLSFSAAELQTYHFKIRKEFFERILNPEYGFVKITNSYFKNELYINYNGNVVYFSKKKPIYDKLCQSALHDNSEDLLKLLDKVMMLRD